MKTKHTATYEGLTFSRTSANRKYSHTVIVVESIASQRAKLAKEIAKWNPGNLENGLAQFDARMAERIYTTADGLSTVGTAGWCGSYELAQKLAARWVKHGYEAHIVEVRS